MEDQRLGPASERSESAAGCVSVDVARAAGIPRAVVMRDRTRPNWRGLVRPYLGALARALDARSKGSSAGRAPISTGWSIADTRKCTRPCFGGSAARRLDRLPRCRFSERRPGGDRRRWPGTRRAGAARHRAEDRIVDINDLMTTMDVRDRVACRRSAATAAGIRRGRVWVVVAAGRIEYARASRITRPSLRAKFPADGRSMRRLAREAHPATSPPSVSCQKFTRRPWARCDDAAARPTASPSTDRARRTTRASDAGIGVTFGA